MLAACSATKGVASHRAALRLWLPPTGRETPDETGEVTAGRSHAPRLKDVVVHCAPDLAAVRPNHRVGIPVTTPQRMLVDLAAVVDREALTRAVERCVVSRLLSIATIRTELDRRPPRGRRGVRAMRAVLADWPLGDVRPDGHLDVAFARLCRAAGLPLPRFQYPVTVGGRSRRLDAAYPEFKLAIEADGFECRTDRSVFQDERSRQNDLVRAGWLVLRFTWHDVHSRPAEVAAQISAHLRPELLEVPS